MPGAEVARFADVAMYEAAESLESKGETGVAKGPQVTLIQMTRNPLGTMAAAAQLYRGKVARLPLDTRCDRGTMEAWLADMTRTRLQAPLEFIDLHFLLENVSRGFTHQLVRQRTAVYVQESQRFAVKEDADWAVYMPPSIAAMPDGSPQREFWLQTVKQNAAAYLSLVNSGVPAEDARGLLPTNILTKVHYKTNLRNLLEHAGNRLCTQAQFEWRLVFHGIVSAIRGFPQYLDDWCLDDGDEIARNEWQYGAIADLFRPICYLTGKCEFMAATDRHCGIRERVNLLNIQGVPSSEWETPSPDGLAIDPAEWLLDPASARKAPNGE